MTLRFKTACTLDDHPLRMVYTGPKRLFTICGVPCPCGRFVAWSNDRFHDTALGDTGGSHHVAVDQSRCFRCTQPWDDHPNAVCDKVRW